jgi:hypothetical protein
MAGVPIRTEQRGNDELREANKLAEAQKQLAVEQLAESQKRLTEEQHGNDELRGANELAEAQKQLAVEQLAESQKRLAEAQYVRRNAKLLGAILVGMLAASMSLVQTQPPPAQSGGFRRGEGAGSPA